CSFAPKGANVLEARAESSGDAGDGEEGDLFRVPSSLSFTAAALGCSASAASGGVVSGGVVSGGVLSGGVLSGGVLSGGMVSGGVLSGELASDGVVSFGPPRAPSSAGSRDEGSSSCPDFSKAPFLQDRSDDGHRRTMRTAAHPRALVCQDRPICRSDSVPTCSRRRHVQHKAATV